MEGNNGDFRILIIEDNPGDFMLAGDFLEEQFKSPEITHAWNFGEAKNVLAGKGYEFDVVLMDLSLPDRQGEDLIVEILALCGKTPVIVLTGYSDISFGVTSLSLGITDYILKDELTSWVLYKSIIYSVERKRSVLALEESEKKYSELFHLSPLPMFVFDVSTLQIVNVNNAAIGHYGYARNEFLSMTI
ncbi:MAG TPA: response regulator, partial [Mucilaginibacter sp.]|nr:response regulator [Mucilaginibacter sp.]